jgi:16S rRNA (guanine527-N7)-methyltransferase
MFMRALGSVLDRRLEHAGLAVTTDVRDRLMAYLDVLARWNRKVNLTAFDLDEPTDEALDRLIVEPVKASAYGREATRALDIGSGGGSPAVPFLVVCHNVAMTLVEARERKGAFLREAVRVVGLEADVVVTRFETFSRGSTAAGAYDVVLMRAVKANDGIWRGVSDVMVPSGIMLWFSSSDELFANIALLRRHRLRAEAGGNDGFTAIRKCVAL